ncbi:MAG: DUF2975 domain-containing protein [Cytophagales bacterium]|jgi:hypothetical protein|nr:DUF2975 domain-containing protein [Cytophagales bacterium]
MNRKLIAAVSHLLSLIFWFEVLASLLIPLNILFFFLNLNERVSDERLQHETLQTPALRRDSPNVAQGETTDLGTRQADSLEPVPRPRHSPASRESFLGYFSSGFGFEADFEWQSFREPQLKSLETQYLKRDTMAASPVTVLQAAPGKKYQLMYAWRDWQSFRRIPVAPVLWGWFLIAFVIFTVFFITWQLKQIFRAMRKGKFFEEQQISRIDKIGYCLTLYGMLFIADVPLRRHFISAALRAQDITVSSWHDTFERLVSGGLPFVFGLVVLALGQVFRYGWAVKRENELTI